MGLFSSSPMEKEIYKYVGGFSLRSHFRELLKLNNLFGVVSGEGGIYVGYVIQKILEIKTKKGIINVNDIEDEFYVLFKKAMYIKRHNGKLSVKFCPICKKKLSFSACECGYNILDDYKISYNDLNKIRVRTPSASNPYVNIDTKSNNYIKRLESESYKMIGELMGNPLLTNPALNNSFIELLKRNNLYDSFKEKNESSVGVDIHNIVKNEVQMGYVNPSDVESKFYLLLKQAVHFKRRCFKPELTCPNCKNEMDNNHIFYCSKCKHNFLSKFDDIADKIITTNISIPVNLKSIYKQDNNSLKRYIHKQQFHIEKFGPKKSITKSIVNKHNNKAFSTSDLNKNKNMGDTEKFKLLLPECAKTLGVPQEECYMTSIKISRLSSNITNELTTSDSFNAAAMQISNDKISYIVIGDFPLLNGAKLNVFKKRDEILYIYFDNISHITKEKNWGGYELIMNNGLSIVLNSRLNKDFSKVLFEKFDQFKSNKNKHAQTSGDNDDINPLAKIKEAKELLDMGAITQEEFEELKAKYLKQV